MHCSGYLESSGKKKKKKRCTANFHWCPRVANTVVGEPMHDTEASYIFRVSGFNGNYDTYSEFICVAPDEATARNTHPGDTGDTGQWPDTWIPKDKVDKLTVEKLGLYLGTPDKFRVLCASFHAG